MDHQSDNAQHIERTNNYDIFEISKPKRLMVIDKIKENKKYADIDASHSFIV